MSGTKNGLRLFEIKLINEQATDAMSESGNITSGALVFVYTAGTKTLATIYSDDDLTSKSNPITPSVFATDGKIKFYASVDEVDIYINLTSGDELKADGVSVYTHLLKIPTNSVHKHVVFPFDAGTAETSSGVDLPYLSKVKDLGVEVVTAGSNETLDVGLDSTGTAGDVDGFLINVPMSGTGFIKSHDFTTGTTETYVSATYFGELMGAGVVGTNADGDFGVVGGEGHVVTGSNEQTITYQASADNGAAGYVHVWFDLIR